MFFVFSIKQVDKLTISHQYTWINRGENIEVSPCKNRESKRLPK